jgi:hypothetical protein
MTGKRSGSIKRGVHMCSLSTMLKQQYAYNIMLKFMKSYKRFNSEDAWYYLFKNWLSSYLFPEY